MPEPLLEELNLDIAPALAAIDTLDAALAQVTSNFSVALSDALQTALATSLDVPLNVDTSQAQTDVTALENEQLTLPFNLDTTAAQADISALDGQEVTGNFELDTGDAEEQIKNVDTAATGASGSVEGLKGQAEGLAIGTELAAGKTGGLTSALEGTSGALGAAAVGGVAFAAFLGETVNLAADAEAQQNRFNQVFGQSKEIIESINVGGLTTSFADLAKQSGTTEANLQAAASRLGLIGTTSGVAQDKVAGVVQQVIGLGGALSVQNPRLGDAAAVTDRLTTALARGGRAAANLGLSIPTPQLNALAQEIAGAGNQVTQFDKIQAGLQITLQNTGNTLGDIFTKGAQNAQVQFRALRTEVEEALVAIGKPLLGPAIESFKAFLPIAKELGVALGQFAAVILPLFEALLPLLVPVAGALKLVADGLGVIADALGKIPPEQIAALAAGFAALGIETAIATIGVEALGVAIVEALGPVGILLVAVGALGAAYDIGGKKAENFTLDTQTVADAFAATTPTVTSLTEAVRKYVDEQLKVGDAGQTAADGLNLIGKSSDDVTKIITGSGDAFNKFQNDLSTAFEKAALDDKASAQSEALFKLLQITQQGRDSAEAQAQSNLAVARSSGLVTDQQILEAEAKAAGNDVTFEAVRSTHDYLGAYQALLPGINDATEAQKQQKLQTSEASGAIRDAFSAFESGSIGVAELADQLHQAGVASEDSTKLAQGYADAVTKQKDATLEASPAVAELTREFESGQIDVGQFTAQMLGLGISTPAVTDALTTAEGAVTEFANAAAQALPTVADALSAFEQGIGSAFSNLLQVQKSGQTSADQAQRTVDQALAARAKVAGTDPLASSAIQNAKDAVTRANAALAKAEQEGGANQAQAIKTAQGQVDAANTRLAEAERAAGQQHAKAISDADQKVQDARKAQVDATNKAAADQKAAMDAVNKASDPQTFIDNLNKQSKQIADFAKNLKTLTDEGFGALAEQLARQGPEAAGGFAEALAGDKTKAAAGEKSAEVADQVVLDFTNQMARLFPEIKAQGEQASASFAGGLSIDTATQDQLTAAARIVNEATPGLAGQAKAGAIETVLEFEGAFGKLPTVTEVKTGDAQARVNAAKTGFGQSGKDLGTHTADQYGVGLAGVAGATDTALGQVKDIFAPQGHVDTINAARSLGRAIGVNFDIGIRQGINDPAEQLLIFDAAKRAAEKAVAGGMAGIKAKSPSEEGIRIGGLFVEGVALGLQDSRPVEDASAALAASIPAAIAKTPVKVPVTVGLSAASVTAVGLAGPAGQTPAPPPPGTVDAATAAAAGKNVSVRVDLHKVDIDPLHLATELGYRLG